MSNNRHNLIIEDGYRRYKLSGNFRDIEEAIKWAKVECPKAFFHGDDDPDMKNRVFYDEPYSIYWSGTFVKRWGSRK